MTSHNLITNLYVSFANQEMRNKMGSQFRVCPTSFKNPLKKGKIDR